MDPPLMTFPLSVELFTKRMRGTSSHPIPILRCGSITRLSLRSQSVAQPVGVKGVKSHPLSDPGIYFRFELLDTAIKLNQTQSLSKINENKQFTFFGRPMSGLQGSILSLRKPIVRSRGPNLGPREAPRKSSGRKITSFHFWEGARWTRGLSMANFALVTRALAAPLLPLTQVSIERRFATMRLLP